MKSDETAVNLEVYDPTGTVDLTEKHAPRLETLSGKTICELSDRVWEDYRTFPHIRKILQSRFPDAKIIPYTEFPGIYGVADEALEEAIKKSGCDGAVVGNAA